MPTTRPVRTRLEARGSESRAVVAMRGALPRPRSCGRTRGGPSTVRLHPPGGPVGTILKDHPELREPPSYLIGQREVFLLPTPCTKLHQQVEQGAGQPIA